MRIVVISGPSGIGKSTIAKRLLVSSTIPLSKTISATTRQARSGEVNGREYYFLSSDDFAAKKESGCFIECHEVHASGAWYGTLKDEVQRISDTGNAVLLEIDINGGLRIAQIYPEAVTIFVYADNASVYEQRLRDRATETEEQIQARLTTAQREVAMSDRYRYRVCNHSIDDAVAEINAILLDQWGAKG